MELAVDLNLYTRPGAAEVTISIQTADVDAVTIAAVVPSTNAHHQALGCFYLLGTIGNLNCWLKIGVHNL